MPIYDYKCIDCGDVFEILVRQSGEKEIYCPECGSGNVVKLPTASYVIKIGAGVSGTTCCGRTERCDSPPCSSGDSCRRDIKK